MEKLRIIFQKLREVLKEYEGSLYTKADTPRRYELWSKKDIGLRSMIKRGVLFASIIIQSDYVGLYYMPMYTHKQGE